MSPVELLVPWVGRELVVVDVEGSGGRPPEIVEIATLRLAGALVTPRDVRARLVRPAGSISAFVSREVHGITDADVAGAPVWSEVSTEVATEVGSRVLVAHSASVERDVLAAHLPGWRPPMVLDTLRLARAVLPGVPGGHGLDNLITRLNLPTPPPGAQPGWQRHRAAYDVWMTAELLARLITETGPDLAALADVAALHLPGPAGTGQEELW